MHEEIVDHLDLMTSHYANIDHEIVYDICRVHIPNLRATLLKIRSDLRTIDRSWSK